jgi:hypothetical protein
MSDTIDQTLWYKIRYTPLRDVLRGRLTARLDLRRPLEEAVLPAEIKQLLHRVIQSTRLWRLERLEVLQELIAHFADGLASGVSADDLIKSFGDEQQAAQLIRRAKRRNRGLPWHALRFTAWSMAALLVVYCGYAAYFFSGRPSPRVNYVDVINKTIENTPLEDRGWTFYRRALIGSDLRQSDNLSLQRLTRLTSEEPEPELSEFVRSHQNQIAWVREGAAKSRFGWVTGAKGSVNDPELWPKAEPAYSIDETGEPVSMASIPPLSGLRYLAMLLRADALVAGQARDGKRLLGDIQSELNYSQQISEEGSLLQSLISMSVSGMTMEDMERALREHPTLISKEDWLALSRRLSSKKVAADLLSFEPERMAFDDMLQRAFTDDGSGNGRLTAEGVLLFGLYNYSNTRIHWWEKATFPVAGLRVPSRRDLKEEYTQALDLAEANLKLAIRDADWNDPKETSSKKQFPINVFLPAYYRTQAAAERLLGHRDGILTGIALELYQREHGTYPQNLDVLVPDYLAEVPVDRISGERVHYRIADGQPVVYSVGVDRNDDGGKAPQAPEIAAKWETTTEDVPDGDWILYPANESAQIH